MVDSGMHGLDRRMLGTILQLFTSTMEKLTLSLQVPIDTCTLCTVPTIGLAGDFTAFIKPPSFVALRLRRLVLSSETKSCVASVSNNARMNLPLIVALMYIGFFFVRVGGWLLSAIRH